MDFEFKNKMNDIFDDNLMVISHFILDLLNKKKSIDVIDLVENNKKNTFDIEIKIKKETN